MLGIFLDIETTGLDPTQHRVLEIAIKIINLRDGMEHSSYEAIVSQTKEVWMSSDPESIQVNGFSFEMLAEGKPEQKVGEEIIHLFKEAGIDRERAVFIGQNSSFDRAFFAQLISVYEQEKRNWPYHWLDLASMYWGLRVHQLMEERKVVPSKISLSKNDIAWQFHIPPEERPHRAMNGVDHLLLCYDAVVGLKSKPG